jgi:hypothetical protein
MGQAAHSSSMYRRAYLWASDGTRLITDQQTATFAVKQIVDMMGKLMRSKAPLFEVDSRHQLSFVRRTTLGEAFLLSLKSDLGAISKHFPAHRHSPYYTLFKRFSAPVRFLFSGNKLFVEDVPRVNAAIEKMRAFAKGPALGGAMRNLRRCEHENGKASRELLLRLREGYSKLLAIRLDFGYYSNLSDKGRIFAQSVSLKEAQQHRDRLLSYLRRGPLSEHLAGYIWRLEYGLEKGHHYHVAIFYNGQALAKDISIADMIGHYWRQTVTKGRGMFFSCNKNKEMYERSGIGMVDRSDEEKWEAVHEALRYLTKQDLYLRFRPGPRIRTFGVGGPY